MEILGFWEDGGVGSIRNQSPSWTTTALAESVRYNYSGTLESVVGVQLPGEDLGGKQQLILVNFSP